MFLRKTSGNGRMMNIERDFHMAEGEGENSYAKNSRRQTIITSETKPVIEKAVKEACSALHHPQRHAMVIADLGCASGPNTLSFVSTVINATMGDYRRNKLDRGDQMEIQFFLNDLPSNDFNQLFRSVEQFRRSTSMAMARDQGDDDTVVLPLWYVSGLPGSYYNRLFPRQSVHLFHSYCIHWRSQVPEGLEGKREVHLNKGNIYITETTSPLVVKLFREQFQRDFSLFLKLRHEELVPGGQMVLTFLGRKHEDVYSGDLNHLFGLLAQSLQALVAKGLVEKEELESFNLPAYGPSMEEVKAAVKQSGAGGFDFDVDQIKLFEQNWDPQDDDSEGGDVVRDSAASGANAARCIRSVTASLVAAHFGEAILEPLFEEEYARRVAEHLAEKKTKFAVVVLFLKKKK